MLMSRGDGEEKQSRRERKEVKEEAEATWVRATETPRRRNLF